MSFSGDDFGAYLDDVLDEFGEGALEDMLEISLDTLGDVFEAKSVELAPVQTGTLSRSTVVTTKARPRGGEVELAYTVNYAAQVHQLPFNRRGARTRAKRGNEFGPAGPQFITRPLRGAEGWAEPVFGLAFVQVWRNASRRLS